MNAPTKLSDLQAMSAQISATPTRAQIYEGELADMLKGSREVEAGVFDRADLQACAAEDRVWDFNWRATGVRQAALAVPDRINEREAMHILKAVMAKLHPDAEEFHAHLDEAIAGLDAEVAKLGMDAAEETYGLLSPPNQG